MREQMKRQSGDYPDWRINRFEGVWTDHEQGAMRHTGDVFDMAITVSYTHLTLPTNREV